MNINISNDELWSALKKYAKQKKIKVNEAVEMIVKKHLAAIADLEEAFGSWNELELTGADYERKIRKQWGSDETF